jgi:hypothetical protein
VWNLATDDMTLDFRGRPFDAPALCYSATLLPNGQLDQRGLALEADIHGDYQGPNTLERLLLSAANFSPHERAHRLTKALNQHKGFVELHLQHIFSKAGWEADHTTNSPPSERASLHLGYLMARILAHQILHTVGMLDTKTYLGNIGYEINRDQFPNVGEEIMDYPLLGHGYVGFLDEPDPSVAICAPAVKAALGLDWDATTIDAAFRYFNACTQMKDIVPVSPLRAPFGFDFSPIALMHNLELELDP